jgi:hypothetical protein
VPSVRLDEGPGESEDVGVVVPELPFTTADQLVVVPLVEDTVAPLCLANVFPAWLCCCLTLSATRDLRLSSICSRSLILCTQRKFGVSFPVFLLLIRGNGQL